MDPQQEIFTELLLRIKALGYDVFDGELPPENTPYPFVYLGDMQQTDRNTKTEVIAFYPYLAQQPKETGNSIKDAEGNQTCVPEDRKNKELLLVCKKYEPENYHRYYNKDSTSSWDFGSGVCF